jgi:hypothetical protein
MAVVHMDGGSSALSHSLAMHPLMRPGSAFRFHSRPWFSLGLKVSLDRDCRQDLKTVLAGPICVWSDDMTRGWWRHKSNCITVVSSHVASALIQEEMLSVDCRRSTTSITGTVPVL